MAGQAGWYRAPGEEGLLRYWNGTVWTEHRQPVPAPEPPAQVVPEPVAPAPVAAEPAAASEPDWSMDQFEKQFAASNDSVLSFDPQLDSGFGSQPNVAPAQTSSITPPIAAPISVPSFLEQAPQPVQAPQPPQVQTVYPPTQTPPAQTSYAAPATGSIVALQGAPFVPAPGPSIATSTQAAASEHFATDGAGPVLAESAPDAHAQSAAAVAPDVQVDQSRKRVIAALRGMIVGAIIIVLGVGAMVFLTAQSSVGADEIKTVGIVTSIGAKGGSCTPVARYAGRGGSFTASTATALTPCPVGLGQSVDVVYKTSNPSGSGQIVMPSIIQQYIWAAPVIGALVFIVSLVMFVVRAGSIARGVSLIRDGGKRRRRGLQPA